VIADLKPYPALKPSGVPWLGEVPEHWETRRLRNLTNRPIRNGVGEGAQPFREDWPRYIRITDIASARKLKEKGKASLPPVKASPSLLEDGDLLLAAVGATYGKSFLYSAKFGKSCFAGYLVRLAPDSSVVPSFLSYWTESSAYWDQVNASVIQATIQNFSASRYKALRVLLLPLDEQEAIVRFLDWVDGRIGRAVGLKEREIALLEEQKQAIITEAVTRGLDKSVALKPSGVPWLGEAPEHWELERLSASIARCVGGIWGSEPTGSGDLICVRVADFDRSRRAVDLSQQTLRSIPQSARTRRLLCPGDLLLEKSGGGDQQPVGMVVCYDHDEPAVCSNFIARIQLADGYDGHFMNYLHRTLYALRLNTRSIKQTTGIQNLDSRSYLSEQVAFPPTHEQEAIVRFLDAETARIDRAGDRLRREIDLLGEYRTRLISDLVTGKLDVREAAKGLPEQPEDLEHSEADAGGQEPLEQAEAA